MEMWRRRVTKRNRESGMARYNRRWVRETWTKSEI